jgi:hypothetical protein
MAPPDKRKKIKTGGVTLEEAKKKINDPNYNVMSGRIEKDKNVQTGKNKRRITKEDMLNIGMGAVPFARIPKFISKLGGLLKPSQRFQKLVSNTKKSKTPALPKLRPVKPKSTAVTKPKNTQIKTPSTAVANRPRMSSANAKRLQQMVNRAALTSGVSELVKPKKSVAGTNVKKDKKPLKKLKDVKVKTIKTKPLKQKKKDYVGQFVNEKGDVAYESVGDFFGYLTGKQKKRAAPKDKKRISPAKKGATKGIAFKGKSVAKLKNPFKKAGGGSMKKTMKMTSGGSLKPVPPQAKGLQALKRERPDVVNKMGGGGAATRGLNFNRGY